MQCSSCENEMFVILGDRAFCEDCYDDLARRQRKLAENYRKTTDPAKDMQKLSDESGKVFAAEPVAGETEVSDDAPQCSKCGQK